MSQTPDISDLSGSTANLYYPPNASEKVWGKAPPPLLMGLEYTRPWHVRVQRKSVSRAYPRPLCTRGPGRPGSRYTRAPGQLANLYPKKSTNFGPDCLPQPSWKQIRKRRRKAKRDPGTIASYPRATSSMGLPVGRAPIVYPGPCDTLSIEFPGGGKSDTKHRFPRSCPPRPSCAQLMPKKKWKYQNP